MDRRALRATVHAVAKTRQDGARTHAPTHTHNRKRCKRLSIKSNHKELVKMWEESVYAA